MNFDEIKKMSKQEFEQFIFKVQNTNQKFCAKCGNFTLDRIDGPFHIAKELYAT